MRKTKDLSLSLSKDIINYMKHKCYNRSRFIENCIIKELSQDDYFNEKINLIKNGNK